jgi:hypothetical protein
MERILKVYIYQDGRRPIFHTPPLSGIYASEGWFMKLLKESRRRQQGAPLLPALQLPAAEARALRSRLPQPQAAGRVPEELRQGPRRQIPVLESHERGRSFPCRLP